MADDSSLSLMDRASNLAKANTIVPVTQDFDESKGVAARTNQIINTSSPLMQTSATKAAQAANARGLNSSTLGTQAGQQAVIETATPIANADASLTAQQNIANQNARNAASTANATSAISAGVQGLSLQNSNDQQAKSLMESARQFDTSQATSNSQFGQNLAFQNKQLTQNQGQFDVTNATNQQQFAADNALKSRQVDAQIAQFAQTLGMSVQELQLKKDALASGDRQALDTLNLQKAQLAQNQTQFDATQGSKAQELALQAKQVDAQIAQFAQNLGLSVQELQLKKDTLASGDRQALETLNLQKAQLAQNQTQFDATQGSKAQELALQAKQVDAQISQFAQNLGLTAQELQLKKDTLSSSDQQALATLNLQKSQLAQQQQQFDTSQANTLSQFNADLAQKAAQFGLTQTQQTALANLDSTTKLKMAQIDAASKHDSSMAGAWGTMMTNVANIQNNSALEQGAKMTLIQNTLDSFSGYAKFYSKATGVDVSDLLTFNTSNATAPTVAGTPGAAYSAPAPAPAPAAAPYPQYGSYRSNPDYYPDYATCFPAGSMVLMGDGREQPIETLRAGDMVMGWNGPVPVEKMETPKLGPRKMLTFADGHKWSEEHPHWTKDAAGSQWWWASNKDTWLEEVKEGAIGGLRDNDSMRTGSAAAAAFAHVDGWKENEVLVAEGYGFDTQLYLPNTGGVPIVIDGYVISGGTNQAAFDYDRLDWDHAPCREGLAR